jgi:hypothetical protein
LRARIKADGITGIMGAAEAAGSYACGLLRIKKNTAREEDKPRNRIAENPETMA